MTFSPSSFRPTPKAVWAHPGAGDLQVTGEEPAPEEKGLPPQGPPCLGIHINTVSLVGYLCCPRKDRTL